MSRTRVRRTAGALAALGALWLGGLGSGVSGALDEPTRPEVGIVGQRTYVVRAGDTLWSIAERTAPGEDPRPIVDAIARANGISAGDLVPGRALIIPLGA